MVDFDDDWPLDDEPTLPNAVVSFGARDFGRTATDANT